jgi:hypothetical protein
MPRAPKCLLGPRHVHPRVNSEAEYRRRQAEAIAKGRALYPNLEWSDPWLAERGRLARIVGGAWQLPCATPGCRNCPSVSPEWLLALCWDCGAVYEDVALPEERASIERLLLRRLDLASRNWLPGETAEDLERENLAHGIEPEGVE